MMFLSRRRSVALSGVVILGLAGVGTWWAVGTAPHHPAGGHTARPSRSAAALSRSHVSPTTTTTLPPTTTTTVPKPTFTPAVVAALSPTGAPGSTTPGGRPTMTVPGTWWGAQSRLPVIAVKPGWVEVRLGQRPNESTAWVPARDVQLSTDPYRIVINVATTHLELLKEGHEVADFPAGVGTTTDPTPTGQFFVAFFAQPPSPGYGAFLMVTSAHSDAISDWEGTGDAIIAIHGPLGEDAEIGTAGARISHGCIRLHDADLDQLRIVPAGTPIDIVD